MIAPQTKLPEQRETGIVKAIIGALGLLPGVRAFRCNTGAVKKTHGGKERTVRFGLGKGTPDVLGWAGRYFFALEVKRPSTRRRVTQAQAEWHKAATRDGAFVAVVTSVEMALAAARACLRGLDADTFRASWEYEQAKKSGRK